MRHKVRNTRNRPFLQNMPLPATRVDKSISIKASISLAVVGHQEPNYCNGAVWRARPREQGLCSAIRDLLGQAASGATFPNLAHWREFLPAKGGVEGWHQEGSDRPRFPDTGSS